MSIYDHQMGRSYKLIGFLSIFIIITGIVLIWFGIQDDNTLPGQTPTPQPVQISEATQEAALGVESHQVLVTEVIDGDTVELENGGKVRLLGIDTPETKDIRKPVECFGKQASNETKNLLEGKMVLLEKDVSESDKYGRLLRYIFLPLPDGRSLFVNDYLIREGFAKALNYPPDVKYNEQFRQAEQEAKISGKGLWGRC